MREAFECPRCEVTFTITRAQSGTAWVRPHEWFRVAFEHWTATCGCRVLAADREGDLYRLMGLNYA